MPRKTNSFHVEAPVGDVRSAVKHALVELGWDFEADDGGALARENPSGLCCSMAPVTARISCQEASSGATQVDLEFSVPGFGPAPKRQLADRSAGLEQRIRRWAASRLPESARPPSPGRRP